MGEFTPDRSRGQEYQELISEDSELVHALEEFAVARGYSEELTCAFVQSALDLISHVDRRLEGEDLTELPAASPDDFTEEGYPIRKLDPERFALRRKQSDEIRRKMEERSAFRGLKVEPLTLDPERFTLRRKQSDEISRAMSERSKESARIRDEVRSAMGESALEKYRQNHTPSVEQSKESVQIRDEIRAAMSSEDSAEE